MKRVARIVFGAAAVLSLLLCVAMIALWVRSYFVQDYIEVRENYRGPSPVAGKFEFRSVRSTWDSTWGRVRFSSADSRVGTNTQAEADAARWKPTRNVSRAQITPQHRDTNKWVRTGPEGFWNGL